MNIEKNTEKNTEKFTKEFTEKIQNFFSVFFPVNFFVFFSVFLYMDVANVKRIVNDKKICENHHCVVHGHVCLPYVEMKVLTVQYTFHEIENMKKYSKLGYYFFRIV